MGVTRSFALLALAIVAILATLQLGLWYPHLPEIVPSHFDAQGQADGHMPRKSYVILIAALYVGMTGLLCVLAFTIRHMPDSLLNIANREYWLAPERREATLEDCGNILLIVASATALLLMTIFHLSALVAVQRRETITPERWWAVGLYVAFVLTVCLASTRKYSRLPIEP